MQRASYILRANIFNVFDRQTDYNIVPAVNNSICGAPDDFFNPRRIQLAARNQY